MTRYSVTLRQETWIQVSVDADDIQRAMASINSPCEPIRVAECDDDAKIVKEHKIVGECAVCGLWLFEDSWRITTKDGVLLCGQCGEGFT
jgi:hypothetical protein